MNELSARTRESNLRRMSDENFDVAIVGGGVTGAGIALDAAARGLRVALVEKADFGSGTSSRSTKLIHGGLRYLEHFQFGLVREALHERATLSRLAPHLSEPLEFVVPIYGDGKRSPLGKSRLKLSAGLWLYDLLAGRENIGRHRWIGRDEVLRRAPLLDSHGLKGAFVYYDCVTDDARLVIEIVKEAASRGAVVANYAAARGVIKEDGRITGVEIEDERSTRRFGLKARITVNATGVWADRIAPSESKSNKLRPSKGVHLVLGADRLKTNAAVLIPSSGENRFLFVVPWRDRVLVGTTDTEYRGELDSPTVQPEEIKHLLDSTASAFPRGAVSNADVISSFAGLRPLVDKANTQTTELSRKEEIWETLPGFISIIGGKLTTYRRIAERVTDLVVDRLRRAGAKTSPGFSKSPTSEIYLAGCLPEHGDLLQEAAAQARESGLNAALGSWLAGIYGGNYSAVLAIARESENFKKQLVGDLMDIEAEVVYAARYEMALTTEDVLERRTRIALLAGDNGAGCRKRVGDLIAEAIPF